LTEGQDAGYRKPDFPGGLVAASASRGWRIIQEHMDCLISAALLDPNVALGVQRALRFFRHMRMSVDFVTGI
jgi:hypothetical protein